jgi:hypothetical protein
MFKKPIKFAFQTGLFSVCLDWLVGKVIFLRVNNNCADRFDDTFYGAFDGFVG